MASDPVPGVAEFGLNSTTSALVRATLMVFAERMVPTMRPVVTVAIRGRLATSTMSRAEQAPGMCEDDPPPGSLRRPAGMPAPTRRMDIREESALDPRMQGDTGEFARLFEECAASYLDSSEGRDHLERYPRLREVARRDYDELCRQQDAGDLDWDRALRQLLPWDDNAANRARGAWIHVAPAIIGDVRSWFERSGWTQPSDWPSIASAILTFVRTCERAPGDLGRACAEFTSLPYTKGFQSGMLSPILNALRPDEFLIVNGKSRATINYFARTSFTTQLSEYADLNTAGRQLVRQTTPVMDAIASERANHDDLFE